MKDHANTISQDREMNFLRKVADPFPRHPRQWNRLLQADAEILDFRGLSPDFLVFKTDGIHEEISTNLYKDPFLIGWMSVTVSISDLAAVGADPLGILVALQLPAKFSDPWLHDFHRGVNEACEFYEINVLGGDTNFDSKVSVTTTAIGTIKDNWPLMRTAMSAGDLLYSTSRLGKGNAFAYSRFFNPSVKIAYKPVARVKESIVIREFANACIDTSDGLFPALSVLAELNGVGMNIETPVQDLLCEDATRVAQHSGLPSWVFQAGPHGEYELIFSISESREAEFLHSCSGAGWTPVKLGRVIRERNIHFISEFTEVSCSTSEIANLFMDAKGDIPKYFQMLMEKNNEWAGTIKLH